MKPSIAGKVLDVGLSATRLWHRVGVRTTPRFSFQLFGLTTLRRPLSHGGASFQTVGRRSLATSSGSGPAFEGSDISQGDFEDLAEELMSKLEGTIDKISPQLNPEEVTCAYGVLTIDLGKRGIWVINKQTPNKQIWWSSPISGPRRFAFDTKSKRWHWTRDHNITLGDLLSSELTTVSPGVLVKIVA